MITTLPTLQALQRTNGAVPLDLHAKWVAEAVFAVEDDEAYFVIKDQDRFYAIIGEIRGDSSKGEFVAQAFGVNQIHEFKHRDTAIACVLTIATNDSGGPECIREIARERAPWVNAYNW